MQLVGRKALNFEASAVLGDGSIMQSFNLFDVTQGKNVLLLFYPRDWTFVCPSELITLNDRYGKFQARNTEVVAISVDSVFSHAKWRQTAIEQGGVGELAFPMVADGDHRIMKDYGVVHPNQECSMRGTFFISEARDIVHASVNMDPVGRDVDEMLRIIDAWQFSQTHGDVCPANWRKGRKSMTPTTEGVSEYLANHQEELMEA